MNRIGRSELVHGEVLTVTELVERTEAVTRADVQRVAQRVLSNERVVALVGPFEEAALTEMALTSSSSCTTRTTKTGWSGSNLETGTRFNIATICRPISFTQSESVSSCRTARSRPASACRDFPANRRKC